LITQEKETLDRIKELNEEEREAFKKKVESRKKGNQKAPDRPIFKPASPHEIQD